MSQHAPPPGAGFPQARPGVGNPAARSPTPTLDGVNDRIQPDYYAVIGVTPDADAEQIRAEYLAKARQLHPDAMASPSAIEAETDQLARANRDMALLNEAWAVLSDPARRKLYDQARQPSPQMGISDVARSVGRFVGARRSGGSLARSAGNFFGRLINEFEKGRRGESR